MNSTADEQENGYIGGSGFAYKRYNINGLSSKTISSLKNAIANNETNLTVVEEGFKAELRSLNLYGTYYAQTFKGYFYAPVSGNYTFRGAADDSFELLMNRESGTTAG